MASTTLGQVERELEQEQEKVQEVQREVPRLQPAAEKDWDYKQVLHAPSLQDVIEDAGAIPLAELTGCLSPADVRCVPWSRNVYCSANFASTVMGRHVDGGDLNEYMRGVDALLLLPVTAGGQAGLGAALLISDREADAVLSHMLAAREAGHVSSEARALLLHLCYACEVGWTAIPWTPHLVSWGSHVEQCVQFCRV